ncbi:MAG TPA: hypothetical protein ENO18_06320 [Caldithrix sp.]|nr:hypothetical protein [Caldithrix sp.]
MCRSDKENMDLMVKSKSGSTNKCKECWNQYQRDLRQKRKASGTQPAKTETGKIHAPDMEGVPPPYTEPRYPYSYPPAPYQNQHHYQTTQSFPHMPQHSYITNQHPTAPYQHHYQTTHSSPNMPQHSYITNQHPTVTREEFDKLSTSLMEFKNAMASRISDLEGRLEQIEGNLNLDSQISVATSGITSRLAGLEVRIEDIEKGAIKPSTFNQSTPGRFAGYGQSSNTFNAQPTK